MSGKTILITGANTGIGKAAARAIAQDTTTTVLLACRDVAKGEAARAEIAAATKNDKLAVIALDVSSFASIRAAAAKLKADYKSLDVLINNAGAWFQDRRVSTDGMELQWETNVVGPHLLTLLLLPLLEASGHGRIVNVASTAAGGLKLDDVEWSKDYSGVKQYSATKQANRMLTWALARRLKGKHVVANAMSPGLVSTELNRSTSGFLGFVFSILKVFARTPEKGADTIVWLATSEDAAKRTGEFFVDRKAQACKFADATAEEQLWAICTTSAGEQVTAAA